MAKDKISLPQSTAGITRYFDDYKSNIEFQPGHIVVLTIIIVLIVIALNIWGASLFGF